MCNETGAAQKITLQDVLYGISELDRHETRKFLNYTSNRLLCVMANHWEIDYNKQLFPPDKDERVRLVNAILDHLSSDRYLKLA